MSTQHDHEHDHEHDHDDCEPEDECRPPGDGCDPAVVDDLACRTAGIAEQARYNAEQQPALAQATADYATARTAYREARTAAALEVQDLRHQVKQLVERIRCQIKQDEVVDCLDRAFRCVCRELDGCPADADCCAPDDCEVDRECPEEYDVLTARIAEYEARVAAKQACFATLVGEPAALTARVAAAKAEVDAVAAGLGEDPATRDVKQLYVAALVAQRHLGEVWNGHGSVKDFVECLCRTLTCWSTTSEAVSALRGCRAVLDCQEAARRTRCEALRTRTVEEVVLMYERLCGDEECADEDPCGEPEDDDEEDCGCGKGRRHRHHGERGRDADDEPVAR